MRWENVFKVLFLSLFLLLSSCTIQPKEGKKEVPKEEKASEVQTSQIQIELLVQERSILISLEDNETVQSLLKHFPLDARVDDFANAEKIVYLDTTLKETIPRGYDPQVYDFSYYAPWHNLVFFYEDQPYDDGLIPLGKITTNETMIRTIPTDASIKLRKIE